MSKCVLPSPNALLNKFQTLEQRVESELMKNRRRNYCDLVNAIDETLDKKLSRPDVSRNSITIALVKKGTPHKCDGEVKLNFYPPPESNQVDWVERELRVVLQQVSNAYNLDIKIERNQEEIYLVISVSRSASRPLPKSIYSIPLV